RARAAGRVRDRPRPRAPLCAEYCERPPEARHRSSLSGGSALGERGGPTAADAAHAGPPAYCDTLRMVYVVRGSSARRKAMDFDFTPQEQAFADEVEKWLKDNHDPVVMDLTRENFAQLADTPERRAFMKKLAAKGWLGMSWPAEYGGRN